jgi:hypothetical protein
LLVDEYLHVALVVNATQHLIKEQLPVVGAARRNEQAASGERNVRNAFGDSIHASNSPSPDAPFTSSCSSRSRTSIFVPKSISPAGSDRLDKTTLVIKRCPHAGASAVDGIRPWAASALLKFLDGTATLPTTFEAVWHLKPAHHADLRGAGMREER